jgi:phospholipid transport system substrate-binding protein
MQWIKSTINNVFCIKQSLHALLGGLILLGAVSVSAQNVASEPHDLVRATTEKVLGLLETGIDPVKSPEAFVDQISAILDPVVAFEYIAKGVLGVHAEKASPEQIKQFSIAFKKGLVNTYGKGISGFQGLDIQVLDPVKPVGDARRATVVQEIKSASGVTKVSYSMAKNRQGQWKMINLVLNGINFGKTFRGQFSAAVAKNQGDLDKTIQQWEQGVQ